MRKLDKKIRLVFLGLIFVLQFSLFLTPTISQAQAIPDAIDTTKKASDELPVYNSGVDESIKQYLCTPEGKGTDLVDCVGKLYRFGITIGVIALIFFLVVAGYIYIVSGESGKTKAKQMLYSAFTGMAIILGSYTLLSFINPALVQVRTIQPPIFETVDMPSCEDIGFSTRCKITTGPNAGQISSGGGVGSGKCESKTGSGGLTCKAGCARAEKALCVKKYDDIIARASQKTGVDQNIIRALIQQESTWNERSASSKGAQGLMQITSVAVIDGKKRGYCNGDINDPEINIMCGSNHWNITKGYVKATAPGAESSLRHVAAAYNGGAGNGHFSKSQCGDLYNYECPFTNKSKTTCTTPKPTEMTNYAVSLEEYYNQYKSGVCK